MSENNPNWSEHHQQTIKLPPSPLLIDALTHLRSGLRAIDIGGGGLRDTKYLLEKGFDVTVIDIEPKIVNEAKKLFSNMAKGISTSFADFPFPLEEFDIANAMYALPFNPPDTFDMVFANIKKSLKKGGIFCGQFFGIKDEWSSSINMSFHTKEQVESLLEGMEIISLEEVEKDATLANKEPHHWHVFHVIARKV